MGKDNSRRLTKRSESARFTFNLFLHLHFTLPRVVDQDVPVTGGAAVHAGGRGATKGPLLHLLPDRRAAFAVRTSVQTGAVGFSTSPSEVGMLK